MAGVERVGRGVQEGGEVPARGGGVVVGSVAKELAGVPEQLDKQPTQSRNALHRAKVASGSVIVM